MSIHGFFFLLIFFIFFVWKPGAECHKSASNKRIFSTSQRMWSNVFLSYLCKKKNTYNKFEILHCRSSRFFFFCNILVIFKKKHRIYFNWTLIVGGFFISSRCFGEWIFFSAWFSSLNAFMVKWFDKNCLLL